MEKPQPYRLVRDSLGFYNQVPIVEELVAEDANEVAVEIAAIAVEPIAKRRRGPKPILNAEFEVEV